MVFTLAQDRRRQEGQIRRCEKGFYASLAREDYQIIHPGSIYENKIE
jgi:hypothetical protein